MPIATPQKPCSTFVGRIQIPAAGRNKPGMKPVDQDRWKRREQEMAKQKSRSDRWTTAVSAAQAALEAINDAAQQLDIDAVESAASDFESAMQDLADVQQEYREWYENMPESLQDGPTGEKLAAVTEIDVENAGVYVDDIVNAIQQAIEEVLTDATDTLSEAESAELPVGFGRD